MARIFDSYANMEVVSVRCTGRITENQGHGPFNLEKVWYDLCCFVSGHSRHRRTDAIMKVGRRVYMTQGGEEER